MKRELSEIGLGFKAHSQDWLCHWELRFEEHSQDSSRKDRAMGKHWLCHFSIRAQTKVCATVSGLMVMPKCIAVL